MIFVTVFSKYLKFDVLNVLLNASENIFLFICSVFAVLLGAQYMYSEVASHHLF
jgi:hypothetical protein